MNIEIYNEIGAKFDFETFVFNGGEIQVKMKTPTLLKMSEEIRIVARLQSSEEVIRLALVKDAIERLVGDLPIQLVMPYIPYARQDRVCVRGEAFSLKVFADLINSLMFDEVVVFDPHSDVAPALFDRVKIISQFDLFDKNTDIIADVMNTVDGFVSPDAGANKKTAKLAGYFGHKDFIRADKLRNLETGDITETIVYADDLEGRTLMIADDIADGGATFQFLAKELKKKKAKKVILFVTHGIFAKGFDCFQCIDKIITTNSFQQFDEVPSFVEVLDINEYL